MDDVKREVYDALRAVDALVEKLRAEGMTWPLYWELIDARRRLFWAKQRYDVAAAQVADRGGGRQ